MSSGIDVSSHYRAGLFALTATASAMLSFRALPFRRRSQAANSVHCKLQKCNQTMRAYATRSNSKKKKRAEVRVAPAGS
jgi:hypothetical protein